MDSFKTSALLAAAMLTGTMAIQAQTVSLADAQSKALSFINQSHKARSHSGNPEQSLSLAYTSQMGDETYYYVFNNGQNGYIIVGGDEVANEILGYSESGTFDYDKLPDNMKWFLSCYDQQISFAIQQVKSGVISSSEVAQQRAARRASRANIDYKVQTMWDQVAPYNSQIPLNQEPGFTGNSAHATGCVATAAAQVMKFYSWPKSGVGNKTLSTRYNGLTYSANFENTTYQWNLMQNSYNVQYSGTPEEIAVGTLMYHVGVAADMTYGQIGKGGSAADLRDLAEALANNFKYNQGITYHEREFYTDEEWENMVYGELAAGRPVLYGGKQESGTGHAFVCDGYQGGFYHINWGWNGSNNDYFLITPTATSGTALCPEGSGSGGGEAGQGYYLSQHIAIDVTPDFTGTSTPKKSAYTRGYSLATTTATPGSGIVLNGYYCGNGSVITQSYNLKMKFTNTADESDIIIGSHIYTTSQIESGHEIGNNHPFVVPLTLVPGKSYYVTLMYENSDGEYVDMRQSQSVTSQVLTITAPDGLKLSKDFVIDNNGYISKNNGKLHFSVKNYGTTSIEQEIIVWIFPSSGGNNLGYWDFMNQSFLPGEEKDYSLDYSQISSGANNLVAGKDYLVRVDNYDTGDIIANTLTLHFRADKPINYTLTSAEWGTLCLPYTAEVPEGLTAYAITGADGDMLVKEEVTTFEMNKPYLINGTPDSYSFAGPDTPEAENLKNGLLIGNTTVAQTYAPQASYVLQNQPAKSGLAFYEVESNGNQRVRQYGAYLKANGGLTSVFKFIDDEETAIISTPEDEAATTVYNLNGIRQNGNAKGLMIVNGKLIYNK